MSERTPTYAEALAAAEALSRDDRLRLIAALAAGLVDAPGAAAPVAALAPTPPAPLPLGDNLWAGAMVIKEAPDGEARIVTNGIDAESGRYLVSLDPTAARRVAKDTATLPEEAAREPLYRARNAQSTASFGVIHGISYQDLAQAGWAVVVAEDEDTRLLDALAPLIAHRCEQQGIPRPDFSFRPAERCGAWFRRVLGPRAEGFPLTPMRDEPKLPVLVYDPLYKGKSPTALPGSCGAWLSRYKVQAQPVDPRRGVPFYLLLAGRPGPIFQGDNAYIPFSFQYDLDVFWGVGRLCFTDEQGAHDYASYRRYAEHVVAFEQARASGLELPYGRRMVYFATRHDRDPATEESEAQLVAPLAGLASDPPGQGVGGAYGFERTVLRREQATKDALGQVLSGRAEGGRPAVLFTAGHGVGLRPQNALLPRRQGALICHGWELDTATADEVLFSGDSFDELGDSASVAGMVAVMFACYGVGCPQVDSFSFKPGRAPATIAPYSLVARLPQRMLAGGALAVLGHVDKAWSYGFSQPEENLVSQTQAFEDVLSRLLDGERMGYVTDQFNTVQSIHGSAILSFLNETRFHDASFGLDKIGTLWKAYHDMRSYALLGDPAVQLPFKRPAAAPQG